MQSKSTQPAVERSIVRERIKLLYNVGKALERPMMVLGLVWLVLVILQFILGSKAAIQSLITAIWIIFVTEFLLRFLLATKKLRFLKRNLLILVSLALPAFRILQAGRVLAIIPTWQVPLLQLLAGLNRSIVALQSTMDRRGFRYAIILTAFVTFAGAAGMYGFERNPHGPGLNSYGSALWWTAMLITTLGSDYFPHSIPGRILCFLLAVFAFSIFGYITAAVASYFVNKDAGDSRSPIANEDSIKQVLAEVKALREELATVRGAP